MQLLCAIAVSDCYQLHWTVYDSYNYEIEIAAAYEFSMILKPLKFNVNSMVATDILLDSLKYRVSTYLYRIY